MDESAAPVPLLSRQGLEETILGLISFQSLLEWPLGELGTAVCHLQPSCHPNSWRPRSTKASGGTWSHLQPLEM